jgi:uncharacterized protein (TIGR03435 family)
MPTDSRHLLAVGIFGDKSRLRHRIEFLLNRQHAFSPAASSRSVAFSAVALCGLMLTASLAPRWIAFAQPKTPTFEVAAIRPADKKLNTQDLGMHGGPGTADPTHIVYTNATLTTLLRNACELYPYQLNGPAWLNTEKYDITANVPPGASKTQFNLMMQNLLTERFHMVTHREIKQVPAYELVIGKTGSKLLESTAGPDISVSMKMRSGVMYVYLTAKAQPLSGQGLVHLLGEELGHPVVDSTGLTGRYDYTLAYAPNDQPPTAQLAPDEPGLSILTAIQDQLGLKLLPKTNTPLDMLIVDSANRIPSEN